METTQFTDPYNQSLVGFNLSGPIVKRRREDGTKGESIIGFRVAGRLTDQLDDDPPATPVYRVKDDVLAELQANPIVELGGNRFVAADFLTNDDVNALDYRPNEQFSRYDLTGKIDARLSDAIDITITGQAYDLSNQFTPGNWRLLNLQNNPTNNQQNYRGNFRFRHRLGGAVSGEDGGGALIQNASYTLQFGYEKNLQDLGDPRHGENLFDYGYIGRFEQEWRPTWDIRPDDSLGLVMIHTDYLQVLTDYTPGDVNPVLANYNNVFQDGDAFEIPATLQAFNAFNGVTNNVFNESWGYHTNVGTVYNLNRKRERDTYTFSARTSFDLVPGGSDKGRHNIQLGVWYEERINREWSINPRSLWLLSRQLANSHIQGIPFSEETNRPISDTLDLVPVFDAETGIPIINPFTGEQFIGAIHDVVISPGDESQFYERVREVTGDGLKDFVNIDALTPDQLSLDMFSARELNDFVVGGSPILNYYGYDYLGNAFNGSFEDFFTTRDPETGLRTFPVAPFRPIYGAAYIQDKFTFKDIIFRLGVRVDRYDANTSVLKDNYSLYEILGAENYHALPDVNSDRPGNIGTDYKVYVNEGGDAVQAYRDGDNWFRPNGSPVNNPALIFQGGTVNPIYASERARDDVDYIKKEDFNPDASFEDYEVQVNVMPRLAFSFPISDEANFFAHYDILVQRPPSNTIASPLDYFYFFDRSNLDKNNPNLKPERTIDYEVGFQQKLSTSSALKISAYYKEMRDMIQLRTFFPVPIIGRYTTFDNLDFGTVKGFSFAYDLRRTGNVSLNLNYTLQFADGTGSNAESQRNVANRGVLRTLFPLSFDERHRIVAVLDYRYGSGKVYNGPRLFGADIFANAGLNLQATAVSGRPYTATLQPVEFGGAGVVGSLNGARQPWNFVLNARIDKNFNIGKKMGLNVYCRVSNLLDRRNVINVYSATGSPDDDGYLASPFGRSQVQSIDASQRNVQAFLASYQWRMLNPNFFSIPRRIYLGAIFDF